MALSLKWHGMRTQIALTPDQHVRVKRRATELGITVPEYIRRLIDQDLSTARPQADLTSIIGVFNSGGSDIANQRPEAIRAAISERGILRRL